MGAVKIANIGLKVEGPFHFVFSMYLPHANDSYQTKKSKLIANNKQKNSLIGKAKQMQCLVVSVVQNFQHTKYFNKVNTVRCKIYKAILAVKLKKACFKFLNVFKAQEQLPVPK